MMHLGNYTLAHYALIAWAFLYFIHTMLYAPGFRPAAGVAALIAGLALLLGV